MDDLERRIVAWATRRSDIRTVVVIGSRGRLEAPADEWADLDVVFTTSRRARYLAGSDWLNGIGDVWASFADPYDGVTRHVLFAGALDAGFTPISNRRLRALLLARTLRTRFPMLIRLCPHALRDAIDRRIEPTRVREEPAGAAGAILGHSRGRVRVILDKDGLGSKLLATLPHDLEGAEPPTPEQFRAVVDEFLFLSVWNAKHLRRGELWWAKTVACDGRMKTLLLHMIEWHNRAVNGADCIASPKGRQFESWIDTRVLERLRGTFGHYHEDDVWRASLETMNLFRTIATEAADLLGLEYPSDVDGRVSDWVKRCEADRHVTSP
jgi:aminoglycoside 6-adenylyltransferase